MLFYNGERQAGPYPNSTPKILTAAAGPTRTASRNMYRRCPARHTRSSSTRATSRVARPDEAEVFVFPRYNWWNNIVRIAGMTAARARSRWPAIARIHPPGDRYYVHNVSRARRCRANGTWTQN